MGKEISTENLCLNKYGKDYDRYANLNNHPGYFINQPN